MSEQNSWISVLLAAIGGGGLYSVISTMINTMGKRKGEQEQLEDKRAGRYYGSMEGRLKRQEDRIIELEKELRNHLLELGQLRAECKQLRDAMARVQQQREHYRDIARRAVEKLRFWGFGEEIRQLGEEISAADEANSSVGTETLSQAAERKDDG